MNAAASRKVPARACRSSAPRLLRRPQPCTTASEQRDYWLLLPRGYDDDAKRRWPLILFLHGTGERGDGADDLAFVLRFGPLAEAWCRKRDLPFVMAAPQLPLFDRSDHLRLRAGIAKPDERGERELPYEPEDRPARAARRRLDDTPSDIDAEESWAVDGPPGGWQQCEDDLLQILGDCLDQARIDQRRIYLTGLSYGGYGTWHMAARHPDLWAAIAPVCGAADPAIADRLIQPELPIWMFHGGRDPLIKVDWAYPLFNALETAGHRSVRFTVFEDLGHNCWDRVYAGDDLYRWFLQQRRSGGEGHRD